MTGEPFVAPRRLHPASPLLDLSRYVFFILIISGGRPEVMAAIGFLVAVIVGVRYIGWTRFTYAVQDGSLVTEGGLLNRTRRVVPLDRIQQVDLQRKLRHRALGLAVVRIDTAGAGSSPEITLDAVSDAEADGLRALLTARSAMAMADPGADPSSSSGGESGGPGVQEGEVPDPSGQGGWLPAPGTEGGAGPWTPGPPAPSAPLPGPTGAGLGASTSTAIAADQEVLALSPTRLALAGVTGSKLAVVFAAIGTLFGLSEDLPFGLADRATDSLADGIQTGVVTLLILAVVSLPVWLAVAAGAAVLTDGGFHLVRRGDVLHLTRGLLDQREASMAIHRVQVVRITQNPLRRALGLVSVTLQSAGGSGQVENQDSRITVPILGAADLDGLLAAVLPGAPPLPTLRTAPPAARRRAWVRRVGPALVVAVVVSVVFAPVGLLALLLVPIAVFAAELAYRGLGWATVGEHVVARRGGLTRETALVPVAKVQSTRLVSSPFQRRAGLATLLVDVAGRGRTPAIVDAPGDDLAGLRHQAIEATAARRDERGIRRRLAARVDLRAPQ